MKEKHTHGGDVYRFPEAVDFSANCNPCNTPDGVIKAMIQAMDQVCHYPDVHCEKLTEALAVYERVPSSYIICGNGAADLIFSLVLAVKPAKALMPAPTFAEYSQALESLNCAVEWYVTEEGNGFVLDEGFISRITEETDMVFVCNPNNPTGVLLEQDFLIRIVKRCSQTNTILMLDECFVDFVEEPEQHTLKSLLAEYPQLFILKAFTKRYAMAGVRLGYALCGNESLLARMHAVAQPWNVSVLAQAAGVAALKETAYVEHSMKQIAKERNYLLKEMHRLGYQTFASKANYIFFKGAADLKDKCLNQGVLIRDCSNYYGLGPGYFRVAVRLREDNEKLMKALKDSGKGGS